jgi:hypothetical protein
MGRPYGRDRTRTMTSQVIVMTKLRTDDGPMTTATNSATTADLATAIDTYLTAYGNPDSASRRVQLATAWAADGRLIDPPLDGAGIDGIDQMMVAVQSQFPGHTFRRTSGVDAHHGVARYSWALIAADGTTSLEGLDVAEFDDAGRLSRVVGFMGPLPAV